MNHVVRDLAYAGRSLAARPAVAVVAALVLGLGIGMTTAMFSIVRGLILRGMPFEDAQRIMALSRHNPQEGDLRLGVPLGDYYAWRERQASFQELAAYRITPMTVSGWRDNPTMLHAATVTTNVFGMLGAEPMLGRDFAAGDGRLGAPRVALIGYTLWRDYFDRAPDAVGESIRVNGEPATVIGVMPEGFGFPAYQQLWVPLHVDPQGVSPGSGGNVVVFGRLKPQVSLEQARADFATIATRLGEEYPESNAGIGVFINLFVTEIIGQRTPAFLLTMLAAVSLVLIIACANVTNLLLARAAVRGRELAVRAALGAGRSRLIGLLLADSILLAVAGAVLGIGVASLGVEYFNRTLNASPVALPFWFDVKIDPAALTVVLLLMTVAALLSGFLPALRASGADMNAILKDESRGPSGLRIGRLSRSLVVAEVTFSCALLVGAGLLIQSVANLDDPDLGLATDEVFVGQVRLPAAAYPDRASRVRFYDRLLESIRGRPGVRTAALSNDLPVVGLGSINVAVEGRPYESGRDYPRARYASFTPGFLDALGTAVLRGRSFTDRDGADAARVAVVNEAFANRFFAGEDPLGKQVRLWDEGSLGPPLTIVGVVSDWYLDWRMLPFAPDAIFVPMAQRGAPFANVVVRATGDPFLLADVVRDAVASVDPDLALASPSTLATQIDDANWALNLFSAVFAVFGLAALLLAAAGIYGVMAFAVRQRTQEVGVRMALGAGRAAVLRLMMRRGLGQVLVGLALGLPLAWVLGHLLSLALFEVGPTNPALFAVVGALLLATGLLACLIPARRATRVDPVVAMRAQ